MKTIYFLCEFAEGIIDYSFDLKYIEERKRICEKYTKPSAFVRFTIQTFTEADDAKRLAHYERVMATTRPRDA